MCAPGVQAGRSLPSGAASVNEITPSAAASRPTTTSSDCSSEYTVAIAVADSSGSVASMSGITPPISR